MALPNVRSASAVALRREVGWALVLILAVAGLLAAVFSVVDYHWNWASVWESRGLILRGWGVTVLISIGALVLTVLVALLLVAGQRSAWSPVRIFCRGCTEFARGMPLLVMLLLGYYGVANALGIHTSWAVGVVILALFEGAYLAEIFRGALESIGATQWEAARAVGFNQRQTWRWVIFPQAIRRALPGTAGQMVSLIKDSSLLSVIGVEELTQMARAVNAKAYTALEGFIPLAVLYLALTLPLSWWARRLEARYQYES